MSGESPDLDRELRWSWGYCFTTLHLFVLLLLCLSIVGIYLAFLWVLFVLPVASLVGLIWSERDRRRGDHFAAVGSFLSAVSLAASLTPWSVLLFGLNFG